MIKSVKTARFLEDAFYMSWVVQLLCLIVSVDMTQTPTSFAKFVLLILAIGFVSSVFVVRKCINPSPGFPKVLIFLACLILTASWGFFLLSIGLFSIEAGNGFPVITPIISLSTPAILAGIVYYKSEV